MKDGTAFILIALSVSPFSYGDEKCLDGCMPLRKKISGATTQKNAKCRVKEISWLLQSICWRQIIDFLLLRGGGMHRDRRRLHIACNAPSRCRVTEMWVVCCSFPRSVWER